jgi:hypothetical protein
MSASTVERRPRPAAAAARPAAAAAEGGASNSSGRPLGVPALALAAPAPPAPQLPLLPPRLPPAAVRAAIVITGDPSPERPAGQRRRRDDGGGAAPVAVAAAAQDPAATAAAAAAPPPPKKPRTAAAPKKKAKPKKKTLSAKARRAAVLGVVAAVEAAKAAGAPALPPGAATAALLAAAALPAAAAAPPAAADVRNRGTAWTKKDTQELVRLLEDPAAMAAALPGAPPSADRFSDADWERLSRRFGRFSPGGAAVRAQALVLGRLARAARRLGPRGAHYADLAAEALAAAPGRRGTAVDVQRWLLARRRRDLDTYPTRGGAAPAYKAIVREALAERPERFCVVGKTPAGLRVYALAEGGSGGGGGGGGEA